MWIERPFGLMRLLFPKALWRVERTEKTVYLSFDDGPVPETTPAVLLILKQYGIKATFFCVGDNVEKYPELFQEIIKQGHRLGNHSFNHVRGFSMGANEYLRNVQKASQFIPSVLMRPPHGQLTPKLYKELNKNYQIVMWDLITRDYNQSLSPERIVDNVIKYARNGSIIVFHDSEKSKKNVLAALPASIEYLQHEGYRFETL
jgi:peptidoglycan/xylan/chitin deacetylase (PgdA/CDA1 family)